MESFGMNRSRDKYGRFDSRPIGTMEQRFESQFVRIPEAGCWIWTGGIKNKYGHGAFKLGDRKTPVVPAHRASWMIYRGPIPESAFVLHRCDNPLCVNPEHLFLGDAAENMSDKVRKNRQIKGEDCYNSKLNSESAANIKKMSATPTKVLAQMFGISRQSVADVIYGRTWKHV